MIITKAKIQGKIKGLGSMVTKDQAANLLNDGQFCLEVLQDFLQNSKATPEVRQLVYFWEELHGAFLCFDGDECDAAVSINFLLHLKQNWMKGVAGAMVNDHSNRGATRTLFVRSLASLQPEVMQLRDPFTLNQSCQFYPDENVYATIAPSGRGVVIYREDGDLMIEPELFTMLCYSHKYGEAHPASLVAVADALLAYEKGKRKTLPGAREFSAYFQDSYAQMLRDFEQNRSPVKMTRFLASLMEMGSAAPAIATNQWQQPVANQQRPPYTGGANMQDLYRYIDAHYNLDELERLAVVELNVDWGSIAGQTRPAKALELVQHLNRRGRLQELSARLGGSQVSPALFAEMERAFGLSQFQTFAFYMGFDLPSPSTKSESLRSLIQQTVAKGRLRELIGYMRNENPSFNPNL